jgi:hypothetical protein
LHGWITQQIDDREQLAELISPGGYAPDEWRIEPSRSGRWAQVVAYSRTNIEPPEAAVRDGDQPVALVQTERNEHLLIALHDPASVLRRCAADRKVLAEHRPQGGGYPSHYACEGCGYDGSYCPEPNTEHVNDCPTLLALAEGYGLTEEQRAGLDRPEPERPAPTGPSLIPDGLAEAMYGQLWAHIIGTRAVEPRPEVKALEILAPELKKIPGYLPTTEEQP